MQMVMLTVLCIVILLLCGSLLSQGFMESVGDVSSGMTILASVDKDLMRTSIRTDYAYTTASKIIQVELTNTGNNKLADFHQWIIIAEYYKTSGILQTTSLTYTEGMLGANQWKKNGIYFNGEPEVFEPGILNSQESLSINMLLDPLPAWDTTATIHVATPNGIRDSISFQVVPGDFVLTAHSDTITIAGDTYFTLLEATPANDTGITFTSGTIGKWETGRWLLFHDEEPFTTARNVYSLSSIGHIQEKTWNLFYRGYATGGWRDNPYIGIDIIIRQENGAVREVIATDIARAYIATFNTWLTISTTYEFPGYTVENPTDYLEVHYYAGVDGLGNDQDEAYIYLRIDDKSLLQDDQTRIQ